MERLSDMPPPTDTGPLVSPVSLPPEVAHIVGVWTEVLLYGIYCSLFFESLYIMLRKRKQNIRSATIFFVVTILMYITATAHIVVNLYRLLRGYVYRVDPYGPAFYFMDFRRWDLIASNSLLCIMTWLGDGLVVYRCFLVWNYNYYIIILPVILLVMELVSNIMLMVWYTNPGLVTFDAILHWMASIYPVLFAQNVITTGLIALRIWKQHRSSSRNGVVDTSSRIGLTNILRIMVESAAVYTFQLLVLLILYPFHHNAQFIVQAAIVPSIGIVFALIAVRVHLPRSRTIFDDPTYTTALQNWFGDDNSTRTDPIDSVSNSRIQLDREKGPGSARLDIVLPSVDHLFQRV